MLKKLLAAEARNLLSFGNKTKNKTGTTCLKLPDVNEQKLGPLGEGGFGKQAYEFGEGLQVGGPMSGSDGIGPKDWTDPFEARNLQEGAPLGLLK